MPTDHTTGYELDESLKRYRCKDYEPIEYISFKEHALNINEKFKCKNSAYKLLCKGKALNMRIPNGNPKIACRNGNIYLTWTSYIKYKNELNIEEPNEG